jgi:hypothetical protein
MDFDSRLPFSPRRTVCPVGTNSCPVEVTSVREFLLATDRMIESHETERRSREDASDLMHTGKGAPNDDVE